jgi:hypothetical protein
MQPRGGEKADFELRDVASNRNGGNIFSDHTGDSMSEWWVVSLENRLARASRRPGYTIHVARSVCCKEPRPPAGDGRKYSTQNDVLVACR